MQHRTKWSRIKLLMLPFVIGIIILAGFVYAHAGFSNVYAKAQPPNPLTFPQPAALNLSLNIYMPLVMFNAKSLAPKQVDYTQTTAANYLSTPRNSTQANEIVASLNIYTPLVFQ